MGNPSVMWAARDVLKWGRMAGVRARLAVKALPVPITGRRPPDIASPIT